jgi:hypothetical protein
MAARDLYYDVVTHILRQEGWRVTHHPLPFRGPAPQRPQPQPAAAEAPLLVADKEERKIAVLVNSFIDPGEEAPLHTVVDQVRHARTRLSATDPDRVLYLAVRQGTYREYCTDAAGAHLLARQYILLLIFDPRTETIVHWNPRPLV